MTAPHALLFIFLVASAAAGFRSFRRALDETRAIREGECPACLGAGILLECRAGRLSADLSDRAALLFFAGSFVAFSAGVVLGDLWARR